MPRLKKAIAKTLSALTPDLVLKLLARALSVPLKLVTRWNHRSQFLRFLEGYGIHVTRAHFYQPIPDARDLSDDLWARPSAMTGVDLNEAAQRQLLSEVFPLYQTEYDNFSHASAGEDFTYHFNNGLFDGIDPLVLYCLVRHFRPRLILEIGSGFSSRVFVQALAKNGTGELVCVEPYPSASLKQGLVGAGCLIESKVQQLNVEWFERLQANDVLFIDSSHVVKIGSDVNYLFLEILPRLNPGVLVHIHDIFLPSEMPRDWVLEKRIFWNEQYLLHAFLLHNSAFEVIFASNLMEQRYSQELRATFPRALWWGGGSFWIRRK